MSEFFGSVWWFILTLGVLVTFHEFGHYFVARRCGVRVLRFSVGFGRALWSRIGRDGTEYRIAAIPLGGYVKMLDGREAETPLTAAETREAFDAQPVWKRIAIVLAGPVANLVLCVALLWVALQVGVPEWAPLVGRTTGLAAEAGFRDGDRIIHVGGQPVGSWEAAYPLIALAAIDHEPLRVGVRDEAGARAERTLPLDRLPAQFDQADPFRAIGLSAASSQDRPVVGVVLPDGAAQGLLREGDEVLEVAGQPVAHFSEIGLHLQASAAEGRPTRLRLRRAGSELELDIVPRRVTGEDGKPVWRLGIGSRQMPVVQRYGPLPAAAEALRRTAAMTTSTFSLLGRLLTGSASTKNVSGVIGIAQAANAQAEVGVGSLLAFMAALSLALCIMNLLPIPVLDGGHLLYYLIELAAGRPLSDRMLQAGQYLGLAMLAGLITLAFYNDLTRLFGRLVS